MTWKVFCSRCGGELPENAYFCPKCGVRTAKGKEENVPIPWQDWRDTFSEVGEEIEKAFSAAAREIEKAFETAREEIKKATSKEPVVCPSCGEKSPAGAQFCHKCGGKLS